MTVTDTGPAPTPARPGGPANAVRFTGIAMGSFLITMDATILNVALPDMRHDLHAPAATLPWAVDAYTVVLAGLMLAAGSVADRWGALRVYRWALAGFALFSLICAAAPHIGVLIAGRALLGVPAAGLLPAAMALLIVTYPEPVVRARRIGVLLAITGVAISAGPVVGGALVALGGWRLVFLVNPPIALLALAASRGLPEHRPTAATRIDWPGLALSIAMLTALAFGLVDAGTAGWLRPAPVAALVTAVVAGAALAASQRRSPAPLLPPELLRLSRIRVDLTVAVVAQLIYYGLLFALSQWMVAGRGMTPLHAGLAFLPMTVPIVVVPMLTGRLLPRIGTRPLMAAGMAVSLCGGLALLCAGDRMALVLLAEALVGIGGPLATPAYIADMAEAVPARLAGTGQGVINAARQTGTALGVALFGGITGLRPAGTILVTAAVVAVLAACGTRSRTPDPG